MLDTPLSVLPAAKPTPTQPIPDSVPEDVKCFLRKFPFILRTGDVMPTPTDGVEHHIHTGSHPPVFAKSCPLDPEKLKIAKAEFKVWNLLALFNIQIHHRPLLCTWRPKKMDPGDLVAITVSIW
jgi:hypothetical protein